MWFSKRSAMFHEIHEESRLEITRVPPTSNAPPCLKINQKVTPTDSLTDKSKMQFLRLSLPVRCRKIFVRNKQVFKSSDKLVKFFQRQRRTDSQNARTPKAQSLVGNNQRTGHSKRVRGCYREKGLKDFLLTFIAIQDKKSLGKTLLSAFRHNSHDHGEDTRSQKHSSFDAGSYNEAMMDPPAISYVLSQKFKKACQEIEFRPHFLLDYFI